MEVYDDLRPANASSDNAGLVLLYAPGFEQLQPAYTLLSHEVFIGREPPAQILIPQPAVSRSHAKLVFDQRGWGIVDLGARNGTLVNGRFVDHCFLQHNDEIRVGDAFLKFVAREAEQYAPYRIDGAVMRNTAAATPSGIVGGYQLAKIALSLGRIARSGIAVVLLGESGTGKEVFARQVHTWSGRTGAFCAVNCAAIPPALLESELFGYRSGAFSGADRDHVGLIRAADQGTLFLDEVGDMPLEAQSKLLRVLQTKEVTPLGATTPYTVDVRIVCATHQDLSQMQVDGRFRGDLFARLNEYSVILPPLRERKEDIYALCLEFLRLHKRPDLQLTVPYMTGLLHYHFPFNVRELEALIKRGIALAEARTLEATHLSAEIHTQMRAYGRRPGHPYHEAAPPVPPAAPTAPSWRPPAPSADPTAPPLSQTAAAAIPKAVSAYVPSAEELRQVLIATGGNVAAVGRHYGKERMQVHRWMKKYSIDPNDFRP